MMTDMSEAEPLDLLKRRFTVAEYLAFDEQSEEKYDLVDGYLEPVLGMAGGTIEQAGMNANIIAEIHAALKGKPCRVYDSNLKVRIGHKKKYRYPDALVICGQPQFDPDDRRRSTVLNPVLVVEVVSDSSERRDRVTKFGEYREIESFREYVLVSQGEPLVEVYYKQDDGTWLFTPTHGLEAAATLRSLGAAVPMGGIYAGVAFPPSPADGTPG
jgi:Uma2 family endonuclease